MERLSITTYLAKYRNDFLRETLMALAGDERMSALVLMMVLAFRSTRNTGFVVAARGRLPMRLRIVMPASAASSATTPA